MLINILIWMLNKSFNGKNRTQLEPCITNLYRRMAKENLSIRTEIVKVKKGKRRYDLMFFETPEGRLKFNLGRHWEDKEPKVDFVHK